MKKFELKLKPKAPSSLRKTGSKISKDGLAFEMGLRKTYRRQDPEH